LAVRFWGFEKAFPEIPPGLLFFKGRRAFGGSAVEDFAFSPFGKEEKGGI